MPSHASFSSGVRGTTFRACTFSCCRSSTWNTALCGATAGPLPAGLGLPPQSGGYLQELYGKAWLRGGDNEVDPVLSNKPGFFKPERTPPPGRFRQASFQPAAGSVAASPPGEWGTKLKLG